MKNTNNPIPDAVEEDPLPLQMYINSYHNQVRLFNTNKNKLLNTFHICHILQLDALESHTLDL